MLRLLPELVADGPRQMALDEALLEKASGPTLRTYRWTPPAVSLGYFQDYGRIAPLLPVGMQIVRRITGGGAIWHEHEVTYALVGRLGHDGFPTLVRDLYPLLHGAILRQLEMRGARLTSQDRTVGDRRYLDEPRCFASPAADDLMHIGGGKVLGSAARSRGERVLIHGSLKIASNPWDMEVVTSCDLPIEEARAALVAGIVEAVKLDVKGDEITQAEYEVAGAIEGLRYGSNEWVCGRVGPRP